MTMTQLLVSARNAQEAEAALRGGAGLIDVKEPANGPLGKADDAVIAEVVRVVGGRVPVSAALGDWKASLFRSTRALAGLDYVKFGLAGLCHKAWRNELAYVARHLRQVFPDATQVAAAYADVRWTSAPLVEDLCAFIREQAGGVILLDTYRKVPMSRDGHRPTLADFMAPDHLQLLVRLCRAAGIKIALAGSLGFDEIRQLLYLQPDWFAVRGAACEGGRDGQVSESKVRELVTLISLHNREN